MNDLVTFALGDRFVVLGAVALLAVLIDLFKGQILKLFPLLKVAFMVACFYVGYQHYVQTHTVHIDLSDKALNEAALNLLGETVK